MTTRARQPEDLAASTAVEQLQSSPPPTGGGDTIVAQVGGGARHVVVGKNIRIGTINVPRWLLYAAGASCTVLLFFAALQTPQLVTIARAQAPIVKCLYPLEMDNTQFNVVMAPFTTVGGDGRMAPSHDGDELARILFRYFPADPGQDGTVPVALRSPQQACAPAGSTDAEQLAGAEDLAQKIHANIVVYGVIRPLATGAQFEPHFYVRYEGFEEAPEIVGSNHLGSPIFVSLPVRAEDYQGQDEHQLGIRMQVLNSLIRGLAYYAQENYPRAIDAFTKTEKTHGWLDRSGKELLYVLLGNAYSRLAGQELQSDYLAPAAAYYDKALALAPDSARAIAGKGSVLYLRALGDLSAMAASQVNTDLLDEAERYFLRAQQLAVAENSSIIAAKMTLSLTKVRVVRYFLAGKTGRLEGAKAELEQVLAAYNTGALRIDDLAGHAHAQLALIASLEGSSAAAVEHYRQAVTLVGPVWQVRYLLSLLGVYAAEGNTAAAEQVGQDAMLRAETLGDEKLIQMVEDKLKTLPPH